MTTKTRSLGAASASSDIIDRELLGALALAARSLDRSTWASLSSACGVRLGGRAISTAELGKRISRWQEARQIDELSRGEWVLAPELLIELRAAKKLDRWQAAWANLLSPHGVRSAYWTPPDLHLHARLRSGRQEPPDPPRRGR